ncbi:MAG: helix-turn-helix domain-containing protein [Pseudonocardiaceae bacterium]
MQIKGTPVYRVKDVAAMVDVDVSTIYRAIQSGELGAYRVGKLLRVPAAAIQAYLKRPAVVTSPVSGEAELTSAQADETEDHEQEG